MSRRVPLSRRLRGLPTKVSGFRLSLAPLVVGVVLVGLVPAVRFIATLPFVTGAEEAVRASERGRSFSGVSAVPVSGSISASAGSLIDAGGCVVESHCVSFILEESGIEPHDKSCSVGGNVTGCTVQRADEQIPELWEEVEVSFTTGSTGRERLRWRSQRRIALLLPPNLVH